ncbi:MAG: hypothetical protein LBG62_03405 [Candidatus Methanoplasma sp.]|nr:hypothetical protein [Candidatus Methanoplasma sp.]
MSIDVGGCRVDVLPVVKGLVSEAAKVREAYGAHEAYGVALGIEEMTAVARRGEMNGECELSEVDLVYAHRLSAFGDVTAPAPAFCEIVDLCLADGESAIPLDMNNDLFSAEYVKNVGILEFVSEHGMAKKGMKKRLDASSPEAFAKDWDAFINKSKGFARLARLREAHMAGQIMETAKYRGSLLAVIDVERAGGVFCLLGGTERD